MVSLARGQRVLSVRAVGLPMGDFDSSYKSL